MKFRYKVLITNLILLSVSLGLVGYLMIHKNFELAKETQISNAVIQNNLVQSSVEYEVLQALNREESVKGALPDIGAQVSSGMRAENVTFFIYYGDKLVYNETEENANLKKVWEAQQEDGNKNYAIFEEDGHYYIYVTAASKVGDENLCMISRSDVSDAYGIKRPGNPLFPADSFHLPYDRISAYLCYQPVSDQAIGAVEPGGRGDYRWLL